MARPAAQTILLMGEVAYLMLRLAFGGSPSPPAWCAFSEMVTDLVNELPLCESWDPEKLRSPVHHETPIPRELPDHFPLGKACSTVVQVPTSVMARADCFIDDLILVFLDMAPNRERQPHTVPGSPCGQQTTRPGPGTHAPPRVHIRSKVNRGRDTSGRTYRAPMVHRYP
jgi:hypothetical protein